MSDRHEINICPFRKYSRVIPAILKGTSDITVTGFMECLKEQCPAFRVEEGDTFRYEKCKRLEQGAGEEE